MSEYLHKKIAKKIKPTTSEYVSGILVRNKVLLSQGITLVESSRLAHQQQAQQIIEACLSHSGKAIRIGITGTPGVGKSTFIENIGQLLIQKGHRVAVLAIDPSSQLNRGSILGDKTRMQHLSVMPEAFIRPSPAGESLGGVARKTRDTMVLCEAAGFDVIIVETVGVGQSEVAVHSMVDFFLLLLLPGAGDELQGIKRGIVEMADLIAINKADDNRMLLAKQAKAAYSNALHLFPPKDSGWIPQVTLCSALGKVGLEGIWSLITDYQLVMKENGYFETNRKGQAKQWMHDTIKHKLLQDFYDNPSIQSRIVAIETQVANGQLSAFHAAEMLMSSTKTPTNLPEGQE